ncbi:hypothetical protein [Streptomyces sp. BE133]|uniref:hypothetical protein n=1 Tax=Streptomyces sp. BE133 TaxID=3002523 RepID=UPI002E76EE8A|nr:hypothetical protein [Streptomyces sp. BE133]MEE1809241.1 hypothetical protein [Streptomyces sp. BE133]
MPTAPDPSSPSRNEAPSPSRRSVLATGTAIGGALVVSGVSVPAQAAAPAAPAPAAPAPATVHSPDDSWRTVLDDADLLWQKLPKTWYEGPYLGNGRLGSGIYAEPGATTTAVRFNVQHSEVQDHRPEFGSLFGLARLPIGHFTLEPAGTITGIDWRMRLHTAELGGVPAQCGTRRGSDPLGAGDQRGGRAMRRTPWHRGCLRDPRPARTTAELRGVGRRCGTHPPAQGRLGADHGEGQLSGPDRPPGHGERARATLGPAGLSPGPESWDQCPIRRTPQVQGTRVSLIQ